VRSIAAETGISPTSVHRYFNLFGLQPHRTESFKLSTDPLFLEKLRNVVGLYLNPPENALVLCVDERSQCQALERTQPMLQPLGLGYVEGVTLDYVRHGTTTLFAALNVLDGSVLTLCKARHRHQEFLEFLRRIDKSVPADLDVPCIVDNYSSHKHPKVKAWLAARARWHMHFIPTYSSWLNQVERFFSIITDKAIRRGSFTTPALDRRSSGWFDAFAGPATPRGPPSPWIQHGSTDPSVLPSWHTDSYSDAGAPAHHGPPGLQRSDWGTFIRPDGGVYYSGGHT
jgi:putative transposase